MQWRKIEMQKDILSIAQDAVLQATRIEKEYFLKHKSEQKSEVITAKRMISHIAYNHAVDPAVIGDFFNKHRTSIYYYIKSCQDFIDTDKIFSVIYADALTEFEEKLAKMIDNR